MLSMNQIEKIEKKQATKIFNLSGEIKAMAIKAIEEVAHGRIFVHVDVNCLNMTLNAIGRFHPQEIMGGDKRIEDLSVSAYMHDTEEGVVNLHVGDEIIAKLMIDNRHGGTNKRSYRVLSYYK